MPNSNASSAAIDFVTALGRILSDAALRAAFAADPVGVARELRLREADRPAFLRLRLVDLEFQARVLLRKRFDLVRLVLPQTFRNLGNDAWSEFQRCTENAPPLQTDQAQKIEDAFAFSRHLHRLRPRALCSVEASRAQFARGHARLGLRFIWAKTSRGSRRPGVQIFLRRSARWDEYLVYFGI